MYVCMYVCVFHQFTVCMCVCVCVSVCVWRQTKNPRALVGALPHLIAFERVRSKWTECGQKRKREQLYTKRTARNCLGAAHKTKDILLNPRPLVGALPKLTTFERVRSPWTECAQQEKRRTTVHEKKRSKLPLSWLLDQRYSVGNLIDKRCNVKMIHRP